MNEDRVKFVLGDGTVLGIDATAIKDAIVETFQLSGGRLEWMVREDAIQRLRKGTDMRIDFCCDGYWRWKNAVPTSWRYGYPTQMANGLVRMGAWNGDRQHGSIVSADEIEWRKA